MLMLKDIHTSIRKKTIIDKLNKQQKKPKKTEELIYRLHMTNCWAVVHKYWMERCYLHAPEF